MQCKSAEGLHYSALHLSSINIARLLLVSRLVFIYPSTPTAQQGLLIPPQWQPQKYFELFFFHALVVFLRYGPVVGKPSIPVSLFLKASRIYKQIQVLEHV